MLTQKPTRVRAQDFHGYYNCPHREYSNRFGDPAKKTRPSEFPNLLFENGTSHEWEVVKGLECETPAGESLGESATTTLELMKRGAKLIDQGGLLQSDKSGIPDLLEKVLGKSKFARSFYPPVNIKAGSGFEVRRSARCVTIKECNCSLTGSFGSGFEPSFRLVPR